MPDLLPIRKSNEHMSALHAPSFNAASEALERAFGFAPVVLSPLGGARTLAQCKSLGIVGDHYEGSAFAAADIDNQRRFRNMNEALFEQIMHQYGWRNIDTLGRPFGREPWHFACHDIHPRTVVVSAGKTTIIHVRESKETDIMGLKYINAAGREDALVGEFGYYGYGAYNNADAVEFAAAERDTFGGGNVTPRVHDVLRQAAINRRNALIADIAAAAKK